MRQRRPLPVAPAAWLLLACAGAPIASGPPASATPAPTAPSTPTPLAPPVARREPRPITLHGEVLPDDYAWLRQKGTPEVEAHLRAELAYAEAFMRPAAPLQARLYAEHVARLQETDAGAPYLQAGWLYYARTEAGKQYPSHCRRRPTPAAPEEVLLDLNAMAEGKAFLSLGALEVSPDGQRLAFTTDETGFRQYTLRLKDLSTGQLGPEAIPRVTSVAWAADARTLLYAVEHPVSKRAHQVWRHVVGQPGDALVLEEPDERFSLGVSLTTDRRYLLVESTSLTASEVRFVPAATPAAPLRLVAARQPEHEYAVDHRDGLFYVRTNSGGRNFRLVTAPVATPGQAAWKELVPHRPAVMLEEVTVFRDFYLSSEREGGLTQLRVTPFDGTPSHRIAFPEAAFTAWARDNHEFDTPTLRFSYQSPVTSESTYDYDWRTRQRVLRKQVAVLGGFDPSRYQVDLGTARARDGTAVPYWTLRRRDLPPGRPAPTLLEGYGAYGASNVPAFEPGVFSLVDRGVVYAEAWVRGGGELGKAWHDGGRLASKPNTFSDFIAVAEHLVATGVTAPDRLAAAGASAGGLLLGVVINQRPDLFRVVRVGVPFVDVINTMLDESLPLTVGEFEEWGNPKVEAEYRVMRAYSPYDNVAPRAYPAMLVTTSYNDSQVMYWEPAKWVARLRATKTDANPLVFRVDMGPAGHGGKSGRYDRLRQRAFDQAFLLWQLGVEPVPDAGR